MSWIDLVGWTEIGLFVLAFLVILGVVWFVPRGPHQGECEHGEDPIYCPDCRGFGEEV